MNHSSLSLSKTSPNREQPSNSPQRLAISFRSAAQGFFSVGLMLCLCISTEAQLVKRDLDSLDGVGIDEKLDTLLPMELSFKNSAGKSIRIADLIKPARPILLSLNYSDCPMLCRLQLNGLVDGMRDMKLEPGKDFDVVSVSIDPKETPQKARETKQNYIRSYGRPATADGWHFLSGDERSIAKLADAVGFRYRYVPERKEYAHAAVTIAITPSGKVSRYLYGVLYPPQTLKLALVEAGEGKIGTTIDRVLLFCFHYDAATGRYAPVARKLMSLGAAATLMVLAIGLFPVRFRRLRGGGKTMRDDEENDSANAARESAARESVAVDILELEDINKGDVNREQVLSPEVAAS